MSMVSLEYVEAGYSRKTEQLLNMLSSDSIILTNINQIIGDALNQFVPMKTGALRRSMYADSTGIHWSTPYAHYQYEGIVYGPNLAGWINGVAGFRSPVVKSPTGRMLGTSGSAILRPTFVKTNKGTRRANSDDPDISWTFGYTTPGTSSKWSKFYVANQWNLGSGSIKAETNKKITAYLKAECKRRGL